MTSRDRNYIRERVHEWRRRKAVLKAREILADHRQCVEMARFSEYKTPMALLFDLSLTAADVEFLQSLRVGI